MFILDKNKDFYDHYSYIYGIDKKVVFDRKGSEAITDEILADISSPYTNPHKEDANFLLVEIGNVQYLIKVTDYLYKYKKVSLEFISCTMEIVREFRDNKNYYNSPLSIRAVYLNYISFRYLKDWRKNIKYVYSKPEATFNDIIDKPIGKKSIDLPILKNTQLTSLLNPERVWKDLQNYISGLNNDKDVDLNLTDVEKAVNHGFDKKTSFRGKL